jgi:hypothetical protein
VSASGAPGDPAADFEHAFAQVHVTSAQLGHFAVAQSAPGAEQHGQAQPFGHVVRDHDQLVERRGPDLVRAGHLTCPVDLARVLPDGTNLRVGRGVSDT